MTSRNFQTFTNFGQAPHLHRIFLSLHALYSTRTGPSSQHLPSCTTLNLRRRWCVGHLQEMLEHVSKIGNSVNHILSHTDNTSTACHQRRWLHVTVAHLIRNRGTANSLSVTFVLRTQSAQSNTWELAAPPAVIALTYPLLHESKDWLHIFP